MGNKLGYPEVDLTGKVAIVTGGNTGIGYATAKGLARLGAHTFIACRSKERAEEAIERIKTELGVPKSKPKEGDGGNVAEGDTPSQEASGGGEEQAAKGDGEASGEGEQVKSKEESDQKKEVKVEFLPLDLSSLQSATDFVRVFKEKDLPLHILINNAGISFAPYRKTNDGFESQFQVNYLSHVLLTLELLPVLLDTAAQSGDVRILHVSSTGHTLAGPFDPEKLNIGEEEYKRFGQYNSTKLYNVMGGFALQRRLSGKNITVSSINPGFVKTEASRAFQDIKIAAFLQRTLASVVGRNPDDGAATSLNCAVNPDLNSQQHFYYDSCRPKESSPDSRNESFQEELWKRTFEFLKDHLSPDTVEKYGPKPEAEGNQEGGAEAQVTSDNQEGGGEEEAQVTSDNREEGGAEVTTGSQGEGEAKEAATGTETGSQEEVTAE